MYTSRQTMQPFQAARRRGRDDFRGGGDLPNHPPGEHPPSTTPGRPPQEEFRSIPASPPFRTRSRTDARWPGPSPRRCSCTPWRFSFPRKKRHRRRAQRASKPPCHAPRRPSRKRARRGRPARRLRPNHPLQPRGLLPLLRPRRSAHRPKRRSRNLRRSSRASHSHRPSRRSSPFRKPRHRRSPTPSAGSPARRWK